jgi:hypothetical protein
MPTTLLAPQPSIGAAGRPQPQTTQDATAGPFIRHARPASRPAYVVSNTAAAFYGGVVTQPLVAAPGYARSLQLTVSQAAGTTTAAAFTADAPFNIFAFVSLKDPWGTPIFAGGGYECLYLINKYSGQAGWGLYADDTILPSYSAVVAGTGAYTFRSILPLEAAKGYGVMSLGNASVLPQLAFNINAIATVLSGTLTTPGAVTLTVDEEYYDVDPSMPVEPDGLGTTIQWTVIQGNQSVPSNATSRIQLPRTGGYLTTLILEVRDSTSARSDNAWNLAGRVRLYIDGVPYRDETYLEIIDRMAIQFQTATRPAGVIAYTFKDSMAQMHLGLLDTLESVMLTNPGTLLEIEANPWGTFSNAPGILYAVVGQLIPTGQIEQGLPSA